MTNGTKIDGTTFVMENLYAKQISSPSSGGLELLGEKSVTVSSAGGSGLVVKNNLELIANTFTVTDTLGAEILAVDDKNVRIGRSRLRAYSALVDSGLQTRQVSAPAGQSLHIQSPTR